MGEMMRSVLQWTLKVVTSVIGIVGMGMILYALWMFHFWYLTSHGSSTAKAETSHPWFIYAFLGMGISFCLITCSGQIAAESSNGHCLSCYTIFVLLFIMLEAAITADIFLNRNWEEDFPEDPTGRFNEFKDFARSNFEMCEWIYLSVVAAQAMSILSAMILRYLGPDHRSFDDSDDEYVTTRLPLLRHQAQQALKDESSIVTIKQKVNR